MYAVVQSLIHVCCHHCQARHQVTFAPSPCRQRKWGRRPAHCPEWPRQGSSSSAATGCGQCQVDRPGPADPPPALWLTTPNWGPQSFLQVRSGFDYSSLHAHPHYGVPVSQCEILVFPGMLPSMLVCAGACVCVHVCVCVCPCTRLK